MKCKHKNTNPSLQKIIIRSRVEYSANTYYIMVLLLQMWFVAIFFFVVVMYLVQCSVPLWSHCPVRCM